MKNSSFGFDVGPTSLGYAIIDVENKSIDAGVRIFKSSVHPKTQEPLNKARREARSARRGVARTKRRVNKLINFLVKKGFLPVEYKSTKNREILCNNMGDVLSLRNDAANRIVTKNELGLILMYFAKHRGFLSVKKTQLGDLNNEKDQRIVNLIASEFSDEEKSTDKKITEYMGSIEKTRKAVTNHGTLGKYQFSVHDEHRGTPGKTMMPIHYSPKNDNTGINKDRQMVIDEFNAIMDEQRKHHPEITTDAVDYIYDTIFFQRPISWDRSTISRCILEGERRRACNTAKLKAQNARVWMLVNTLKYDGNGTGEADMFLSQSEKVAVAALFNDWAGKTEDVGIGDIKKVLGITGKTKINIDSDTIRKCNTTNYRMREAIGDAWDNTEYQDEIINLLLNVDSKTSIFYSLQNKYGMNEKQAIRICSVDLEAGYSAYSEKALNKLLPHLMDGFMIHEATKRAGYKKVSKSKLDRMGVASDTKNPIVNRGLSVLRKVNNTMMDTLGRPDVVGIELVRDLMKNTKKVKDKIKEDKKNRELNNEARVVIMKETGIGEPSKVDLHKYRLWKEQDEKCIYSGNPISLKQLFSASVEVDHILPYSKSYNNGLSNKVVCFAKENQRKGDRTPIDAFGSDAPQWKGIKARIAASGYPKHKASKFKVSTSMIDASPMRLLNDTSYIAKNAKGELETVHDLVQSTNGMIVSKIARAWDLYSLVGDKENGIKDREDNRHHSIDAIVIAAISLYSYRFEGVLRNNLIEDVAPQIVNGQKLSVPMPWKGFRDDVKQVMDDMVVSHEVNNKSTGSIHKATALRKPGGKGKNVMSENCAYFTVVHDGHKKSFKFGNNHHLDVFDVGSGKRRFSSKVVTMADVYQSKRNGEPVVDKTQAGYWGTLYKGTTFTLSDGNHYVVTGIEQGGTLKYRNVNHNGNDQRKKNRIGVLVRDEGLTVVHVDILGN